MPYDALSLGNPVSNNFPIIVHSDDREPHTTGRACNQVCDSDAGIMGRWFGAVEPSVVTRDRRERRKTVRMKA